jgi:tetratricopeptide (TPR) repeat protein
MKTVVVMSLSVALVLAPTDLCAQHGGGSRGGGRPGGGGGGWQGGHSWQGGGGGNFQNRSSGAPNRMAAGAHGPSHPAFQNHGGPAHAAHFAHRPTYHGGWYHGDWHGHWAHPWVYRPWGWWGPGWGWGLGWGIGFGVGVATVGVAVGSPWAWGYYNYWNPYWVAPVGVTYIDYSRPIVVQSAAQPAVAAAPDNQQKGLASFDMARALFKRGDYPMALAETNRAIALLPHDSVVHEFRALCLFATQDYQQAAAAVHAVLTTGPGWDWQTVAGLYPDTNIYATQLRNLESYCDQHPDTPAPRFLLAYHHMLGGHNDQAASELEIVTELEPNDQLATQLLKGLKSPDEQPRQATAASKSPPPKPVGASELVGNWKASRTDGSSFELKLTDDNKFHWKVTGQAKNQELAGTYTLADNYLILSAPQQSDLIAQVDLETPERMTFKLAGGSPDDPGLTFNR